MLNRVDTKLSLCEMMWEKLDETKWGPSWTDFAKKIVVELGAAFLTVLGIGVFGIGMIRWSERKAEPKISLSAATTTTTSPALSSAPPSSMLSSLALPSTASTSPGISPFILPAAALIPPTLDSFVLPAAVASPPNKPVLAPSHFILWPIIEEFREIIRRIDAKEIKPEEYRQLVNDFYKKYPGLLPYIFQKPTPPSSAVV